MASTSAIRGPRRPRSRTPSVRVRHARRLRVLPPHGPASKADAKLLQGRRAVLERDHGARHLRRIVEGRNLRPHLKDIQPAVMTVGGWFDAENLFGALEMLQADRGHEPDHDQPAGDGPVVPRRLGTAAPATASAPSRSTPIPPSSTAKRSSCRSSKTISRADQPRGREPARGLRVRDRHERVAATRRLAPKSREVAARLLPRPGARWPSNRPPMRVTPPTNTRAIPRTRCRSSPTW